MEPPMLDWISDGVFALLNLIPGSMTHEGSVNYMLVRSMLGLLFVVLFIALITFAPIRIMIANGFKKLTGYFGYKS
jgi:hypothetical protein